MKSACRYVINIQKRSRCRPDRLGIHVRHEPFTSSRSRTKRERKKFSNESENELIIFKNRLLREPMQNAENGGEL